MKKEPKKIHFVYIELAAVIAAIIFVSVQLYRHFFPS
jgi:hypothetical protein